MHAWVAPCLVCPASGAPLRLEVTAREGEEILEGALVSTVDEGVRYPIRGGVPRFVVASALPDEQRRTIESFEYKWSKIPSYALEEATRKNREAWYFQRFGFPRGDADVRSFLAGASYVLEAGTGTGVDTDLLARNSEGRVLGVDLSNAIDEAYRRFRDHPRVGLIQADIGRLPFAPGFFDVVSCDQVLHHTPDPPANFARLAKLLSPGRGRFLLYVYKVKGPLREHADDILRARLTKAPVEDCLDFSERIARFGRALSRLGATVELEDDLPELGIARGRYDVQRLIYDHVIKCFWNEEYDFATNAMINFDWYRPEHAFRYREADVRSWAEGQGLRVARMDISPSGISAILERA